MDYGALWMPSTPWNYNLLRFEHHTVLCSFSRNSTFIN